MRGILQVILAGLATGLPLPGQNPGMTTEQTRALTSALEMGHSTIKPDGLTRSLSFEEGDDPTVIAHPVPQHEPLPAARKIAEQAEHLAHKKPHKKQTEEAIAKYRQAVALDPLYFQAWNNLALELNADGKPDEAEQVLRRLMQSSAEHVVVFTNLAAVLSGQKRYADAETVARQAMKLHGYSFSANYVLGTVLVNEGRWTEEARTKLQYAQLKYPEAKSLLDHWPAAGY